MRSGEKDSADSDWVSGEPPACAAWEASKERIWWPKATSKRLPLTQSGAKLSNDLERWWPRRGWGSGETGRVMVDFEFFFDVERERWERMRVRLFFRL